MAPLVGPPLPAHILCPLLPGSSDLFCLRLLSRLSPWVVASVDNRQVWSGSEAGAAGCPRPPQGHRGLRADGQLVAGSGVPLRLLVLAPKALRSVPRSGRGSPAGWPLSPRKAQACCFPLRLTVQLMSCLRTAPRPHASHPRVVSLRLRVPEADRAPSPRRRGRGGGRGARRPSRRGTCFCLP